MQAQILEDRGSNFWPSMYALTSRLRGEVRVRYAKVAYAERSSFVCPICQYAGPFTDYRDKHHFVRQTRCPRCELYERHRLQFLVMQELAQSYDFSRMSLLHFAPEPYFRRLFSARFALYQSADISAHGVDYRIDMRRMPFPDAHYDVIYASHVLEHIDRDSEAIAEIHRVLKPNGIAILPVPIVSPHTVEYPEPNEHEFGHVRAPGVDYFDRYRRLFARVEVRSSRDFDASHQLYTFEDRTGYPNRASAHRVPMPGEKHEDYVPICYR